MTKNDGQLLLDEELDGFALHEIILDEAGRPIDYRFLEANSAFEKLTGLKREAVIGKTVREVLPEIESYWIENYGEVALTGQHKRFENHANKLGRDYEIVAFSPRRGQFATIFIDVTEHKRSERTLQESEALLRSLFGSPGIMRGIVETVDHDILHVSDNLVAATFFEQTEQSMRNRLASEMGVPKHIIQMWVGHFEESRRSNTAVKFEYYHNAKGKQRWLSSAVSYLGTTESGRPRYGYVTTDITEAKRAVLLQDATYAISQAANRTTSFDDLYKAVHDIIAAVMPARNFSIALYDGEKDLITYPYFVDEVDAQPTPRKAGKGLTEYILRTGKSLLCDEAKDVELQEAGQVELIGSPSPIWLGVPLLVDTKVIGVMAVQHHSDPRAYGLRELEMLEYVSVEVGGAIERKYTEKALRQAEARYRDIFENAVIGIYRTTRDGRWLAANSMMARIFGYGSPEELMAGTSDLNTQFYTDPGRRIEFIRLVKEHVHLFEFESQASRKDGSVIWISEDVRALHDSTGNLIGFEGAAIDITERKKSEEILRQQSASMAASLDGMAIRNANGEYIYLNDAYAKIYGYASPAELTGRSWEILYDDMELRRFKEEVMPALREKGHWQGSGIGKRKDGSTFPQEFSLSRIEGGGLVSVVHDITDRKAAEERLRQSEEQFRLISENVTDMIALLDLEGRRVYNSPSYKELFGDPEKLRGTDSFNEIHPEDRERIIQIFRDTVRTGIGQRAEYRFVLKDGSTRHIESQASTIKDKSGKVLNVLVVSRDVTEKKALDQQFLRAQRMESIGRLSSGIAHDLNNVLTPIMMSIDILRSKLLSPGDQKLLDTVETSVKRGSNIVKQVLAFGRGVKGERIILQPKHVITEVAKIVGETFPKSIELQTDVAKDLWTISADPTQIHQVLLNLCVNARDAMPDGGILTISAENVALDEDYARMHIDAKAGPYVAVCVTDTGTGIPANILDRIFEPFFTTKEFGRGTGLGLSTTLAIVKSHGGFINVYSETRKGTTFRVYLPAQKGDGTVLREEKEEESPRGHGELILVVDDEASIREVTKGTLESSGYRVIAACDGAEAIALYAQKGKAIKVVITDMVMPIMDGTSTIRALHMLNPEVRIIATSGFAGAGQNGNATNSAASLFLIKPYTARKLLKALEEVLGEGRELKELETVLKSVPLKSHEMPNEG